MLAHQVRVLPLRVGQDLQARADRTEAQFAAARADLARAQDDLVRITETPLASIERTADAR